LISPGTDLILKFTMFKEMMTLQWKTDPLIEAGSMFLLLGLCCVTIIVLLVVGIIGIVINAQKNSTKSNASSKVIDDSVKINSTKQSKCPVCRDRLKQPLIVCPKCKILYHTDCWNSLVSGYGKCVYCKLKIRKKSRKNNKSDFLLH
jgi:hypothetical protein